MKQLLLWLAGTLLGFTVPAQYYFKDVIGTRQVNELNRAMKKARVTNVVVKNYNFDDSEIDDFLCEQSTDNNCKYVFTITGSPYTGENRLHSWFNNLSQITRSVDSNVTTTIQNNYQYDASGNLVNLTVTSFEPGSREKTTEAHLWQYNGNHPEKMQIVKNGRDTTNVFFTTDEKGNTVTEVLYKNNRPDQTIYYYYDAQNRLTDIVKYSYIAKRLLPETIFEYNEAGQLAKRTDYVPGRTDYQFWIFKYDTNGLKTEEHCYLKGNMFRGKLIYKYRFEKE